MIIIKEFKVTRAVKAKLWTIAEMHRKAAMLMKEVEGYLESKGLDIDELRDGSGVGLEEFEYGVDTTKEFCDLVEKKVRERCK